MKRKLSLFVALVFVFSIMFSVFTVNADRSGSDESKDRHYKDGEILVKYNDDVQPEEMKKFASGKGMKLKKTLGNTNIGIYEIRSGMSVNSAVKSLMKSDLVEYAQPNYIYKPLSVPSDEMFDKLWGLNNFGQKVFGQAGLIDVDINAPEAWDITQGREDIVVAVIDDGVYINHPDLSNNIWVNTGEIPDNGKDDDNNGYIDDINGWNFYDGNSRVFDDTGNDYHGTHVAGIIASSADDIGVVGVAPGIKIMPLRFMGEEGGTTLGALYAIEYAIDNGAHIVNCSWGGEPGQGVDNLLKEYIEDSGLLFIAAAGNEGNNNDSRPVYPASFDIENMISVAAVNNNGDKPYFSNYGKVTVDVGAPGVDIFSTAPMGLGGTAAIVVRDDEYAYQVFYSSLDISDFINEEERIDYIEKIVGGSVMDISIDDKILLVDDDETDGPDDVCEAYSDILDGIGFENIEEIDVAADSDGPSFEEMDDYDVIIWLTGKAFGDLEKDITALSENDRNNIIQYLQNSKKLILIGEDSLYGIEDSSFFTDYLKIDDYMEYGTNEEVIWNEELFGDVSYEIGENEWRDIIIHSSEDVEPVMEFVPKWGIYRYDSGTSMAAPHISGVAALLLSKNPYLSPIQIKTAIMNTVKPLDSLRDKTVAEGMADAFTALKATAPSKPVNLKAVKSDSNVTLTWSAVKSGDFKEFIIEKKIDDGEYEELMRTSEYSCIDADIEDDTKYKYKVKSVDIWGNVSKQSSEVTVNTSTNPPSGGGGGGSPRTEPVEIVPPDCVDGIVSSKIKGTSDIVDAKATVQKNVESASISFESLSKLDEAKKTLRIRGNNVVFEIFPETFTKGDLKYMNLRYEGLDDEKYPDILKDKEPENAYIKGTLFDLTASVIEDKKSKNVEGFSKKIQVSIKLNSIDADKYDRNKLGVYRYDDNAGRWDYAGGRYESSTGTISFATDHFSKYAIMAYTRDFYDLKSHWAKADIDVLISKHIAEGRSYGFEPDEYITRAELVRMLVKAAIQMPDKNIKLKDEAAVPFPDVSNVGDDRMYIAEAVREGIIKGLDDGTFGPQKAVSREELAVMIARMIGLEGDFDIEASSFKDKKSISAWAARDVAAVYEKGIVTGDIEGNFDGKRAVTRAEAAVMVRRMLVGMGLIDMPVSISGKLVINYIEGTHYELETEDGIYVLIANENDRVIKKMLSSMIGNEIKVKGYIQDGFNIYQRGKLLKVIYAE